MTQLPLPPLPQGVPAQLATLSYAFPTTQVLKPVRPRATSALACQWLLVALNGVVIVYGTLVMVYRVDMDDLPKTVDDFGVGPVVLAVGVGLGLTSAVIQILATVYFCMWQYRVHHNASVFAGHGALRFTPGWGIAYWFIPIIAFFRPYQVVREIDQVTSSGNAPLSATIGWWWGMSIASVVVSTVARLVEELEVGAQTAAWAAEMSATAIGIGALTLTIRIIRSISDRQAAVIGQ
jgi:hypothetical protein